MIIFVLCLTVGYLFLCVLIRDEMFKLPAQLTISHVDECKAKLLIEIDDNDIINFDDGNVTKIDTVGVQLLLAAVSYIALQNKEFNWSSTSSVVQESIKQLGLNESILNKYLKA
ncbi:MAG: anti-anti-sigma regulatory factor [Oleispira sp.]|jgi:anti-anti-sigma regulatory factor